MYLKHNFLARAIQGFTANQSKLKLIEAVRDNYKVVDTSGYSGPYIDHNAGVRYDEATITPTSVFHMWKFWDDTVCTTGLADSSSRYTYDDALRARRFYKALGTDASTLCKDMNSNDGITIGHFTLDPSKYTIGAISADADATRKYINVNSTLGQWEECNLKYSRTRSAVNRFYGSSSDQPSFDDLKDDSIVSLLLSSGYSVQDPTETPVGTLTLKERLALGDLTPTQKEKMTSIWHNGGLSVENPHMLLAFTILDDGTIFEKEAKVLTRTIREDWVSASKYLDAEKVYTLEVVVKYRFRRIVRADVLNVATIVAQLQDFQMLPTSWVDGQVNDMLKLNNFSLSDLCLGIGYSVEDEATAESYTATKWYVSVEKFDYMAENDLDTLYGVLAGTASTASIIDVYVEKEKSSYFVRVLTLVVTAVAIVVSAIFQQWWIIPLITAVYAAVTILVSKYGKMADAMVIGKFATIYTVMSSMISLMTAPANNGAYVASQQAATDMTFEAVSKSAFEKLLDSSFSELMDKGLNYVTNGLIDYASMSFGEITARVMGLTNNLINVYMAVVSPPPVAEAAQTEAEAVTETVEYYETLFTLSDDYNFCELNQQMEMMPYEMTEGFVIKSTSKYYNAL